MKNREMLKNKEGLDIIRTLERTYEQKNKEKLFRGRIKITYAINKNLTEMLDKLKPFEETRNELIKEYRDVKAEQEEIRKKQEEENARAKDEERDPVQVSINVIMKEGKELADYQKKLEELAEVEVSDVSIHTIKIEELEGIPINSDELSLLMFMIE